MSLQTEKWLIVVSQWSGLFTARDSDDIPNGSSPDLLNVRINGSHFRGALGYELKGTRNSNSGEITSQYTYKRNDGDEVMVRVRDNATTGILEWYDATNKDWYTLLASLTTGKIMGFTEFNYSNGDEDVNQMMFCNGIENMSVWTGATTRLSGIVSGSPTSITVASTTDFPASGTIIYNGTEVAYTSKTATTFVKSSGSFHDSAGSNDGVAEAADDSTHSGVTKGNILLTAFDRLWIAGIDASPLAFDFSDEGAALTFTGGTNRSDSGTETALNIGGKITGLANKNEEIIVFGIDGALGFKFVYPTSTTKAPLYREVFQGSDQGCINHKSVVKINNEVYFVNKNGLQALSDLEGTEKVFNKSVTRDILSTLKNYDFVDCSAKYFDKENILLLSAKSNSDLAVNDVIIALDFYELVNEDGSRTNTYSILKFDWPVNDWAILDNELYFGSSAEMNSFKAFSTFQNDGAPRNIRYATKRFKLKDPFQEKASRLAAARGFIKDGTDIKVEILYNAGFIGTDNKTIESTGSYVSQSTLNDIGAFALGTNPIGGVSEGEVQELKEFLVYLDIGVDYNWNDIEFIFSSDTDGGTFIVTDLAIAAEEVGFASRDDITI